MLSANSNHGLAPSSSREQRSSMRNSSKNQPYCEEARELDLTEVGAWCHLDQLQTTNDDPHRSRLYQVLEPELRGAVGELQCVCKRLQSIIDGLERRT
ncbi:hypothetical protein GT037_008150 [Alternaria burnsii]|uniref:Uncharacterized protein n=1 Tax=Alternaria burnsii TaxID=1187904 RepID=A0A8H7B240_9PLEO|nr:uncharacterized protein GT037_008150 [Alternaria burnsii]KAF7673535.1 hypothetical protein GT037_008150 [Alternaria burnsii]